ncbi:hypothetical protein, partial [uncultured Aeromicrobium sp.]|uniref:hypothetical protein n=2 Tax=Aeromicrobium TaxID=2040 RepID=UPI0025951672
MSVATLVALVLSALAFGALPAQAEPEAKPKVALLAADEASWIADVQDKLVGTGGFSAVDAFPVQGCSLPTPTLA